LGVFLSLFDAPPLWFAVFAAGAVAIVWAGSRLPLLGKSIALGVGVGETAVGLFVLAVVTSLPELAVTLSAMRLDAADLAMGNVLGSNNFNLATAGVLSMLFGGVLLSGADARRYLRTGTLVVVSTALAGTGIALGPRISGTLPALLFSVPIIVLFIAESRIGTAPAPRRSRGPAPVSSGDGVAGAVAGFVALSAVVVISGVVLSWASKRIADHEFVLGGARLVFGQTFVGTLLVAVATSLPEVTVAYSAIKNAGSADMAMGTLLGSNSFNLLVFALGAPFMALGSTEGVSAWSKLSSVNMVNVIVALALTLMMMAALRWGRTRVTGRVVAALTVPVYLAGLCAVYVA
jgi:cation:H+ antiporter